MVSAAISVTFAGFALIALILRPPRVACMFKKTLLVPLRKGRVLHNVYQNQGICKLLIPNDMKLCRCILYIGERKVRGFSPVLLKMSRGKLGRKEVMNYHSQLASDLQIEPLSSGGSMARAAWKVAAVAAAILTQNPAYSQAPQPTAPPPVWTGNVGAGLALTNGNTDTKNINISMGI